MTVLSQRIQTNPGFRTTHSRRSFVCRAQAPKDKASPVPFELRRNSTWSAILADKMIGAVDDIGTHVRRIIRNNMGGQVERFGAKPVICVLGTGWGAHSLVKVVDTDHFDVAVVSPSNAFLFTPMLPSTATGTVEFRSLLEPIRAANEYVQYFEAECQSIDVTGKKVTCKSAVADGRGNMPVFHISYDILVVAVGEKPASFGVPGVEEYAFFLKTVRDAANLRKRIQEVFELASLPGVPEEEIKRLMTMLIVGAGPTGVEFAGTLSDFVKQDLRKKYPRLAKYVKVVLLQSGDAILTQFDTKLAQIAMRNLEQIGVDVRTGQRVTKIDDRQITLANNDTMEYGICVWSAGNSVNPLVSDMIRQIPQQMELNNDKPRKLHVDPFLRVIGTRDVIALGDCSFMEGNPLPPTAQVAAQQGAYVSHVVNRRYNVGTGGLDMLPPWKPASSLSLADRVFSTVTDSVTESVDEGGPPKAVLKKPFEFLSLGILASIGDDKAIAQVEAFDSSLDVWGSPAFLLWKSVYITKQVSIRNRVLILFDWLKTQVFGRDLSQF
ncbi:hypothetical protein M9434_006701 [Picochlorum sp. BPE23]|nr:hypothetical protein M9434_006701 [Picochlorum sp. BPE23]